MKTKHSLYLLCGIILAFVAVSLILFINFCSAVSGEVIEIGENMTLFVSLGVVSGITLILDVILGAFMGLYKYKAINGFSVFTIISSAFISILILLLVFSA